MTLEDVTIKPERHRHLAVGFRRPPKPTNDAADRLGKVRRGVGIGGDPPSDPDVFSVR